MYVKILNDVHVEMGVVKDLKRMSG